MSEGIAADEKGNIFAAEVGPGDVTKVHEELEGK
jgi:hypothetical protein